MESTPDRSGAVQAFISSAAQPGSVDSWVARLTGSLLSEIPEVADDTVLAQGLPTVVRDHWMAFLASLDEPQREVRMVQSAVEFAAALARRGHPLTTVFRIYRLAQQFGWNYVTSVVDQDTGPALDVGEFVMFFWGRASSWLDASVEASVEVFQVERERALQGAAAKTLDAVRTVLAGGSPDPRELSALLGGHRLNAYNTAVLLHTDDVERISDLTPAVALLAKALALRNPLVVSPGGRDLWCWFASTSAPILTSLRTVTPWLAQRGVQVAVGTPLEGLDGFRLSHLDAQVAQKISARSSEEQPLTLFPEVEVLAVMSSTPAAAERFVRRILGGLADDAEGPVRLRGTLQARLSTGSVDGASRQLNVHKNTVRYRVGQAEALLGSPDGWSGAEVELAIRYYDTFLAVTKQA